jgi:hypothetical protein
VSIIVGVKINDGVVLAADSAATLVAPSGVVNVYENANKVFNLCKGRPIGAVTCGAAGIGQSSIERLAKDLRRRLSGEAPGPDGKSWALDTDHYKVGDVAQRAYDFLYWERCEPLTPPERKAVTLSFIIAGYSAGRDLPEVYSVAIREGECAEASLILGQEAVDIFWDGDPEAVSRLLLGHSPDLADALREAGVAEEDVDPLVRAVTPRLTAKLVAPPMPIQDAIDLAEFLVHTAIMFRRFSLGAPIVGGAVEVAAITKHEGFKWIKRKHYYDRELNPVHRE